ncbi:ankyrin repeat domain-containing protein 17 [Elysia marginata]|uniref:Ankyrin repeat domain-containing protein 17 n=1 Tax=Elysia marginata TaxID=1093978 RepID=A0AAV4HDU5_9GAST|nr:ankyrin repeat domain-containing protein 17 [Elysia marginata]
MMQDVNIEKANKESRTVEIGQMSNELNLNLVPPRSAGNSVETHSNFGPDMSGSDMDEASELSCFITRSLPIAPIIFGINKQSKDGKPLSDPEVLRTLTSSVSSALDEAAQALHRMRDSQGQIVSDSMQLEAGSESDSIGHRPGSGSAADATEEGESLLSLACSAGYYELAQVLLAMKANVEDRGIKGDCTPLMEAASGGHVDIVRLLLLHHADINAQSRAGNTPLHYGACGGFKEVVQELMLNGANVEIHNENGHTPLMEAASAGHVDVAKILLEHGAGINTHSNEFKESALTLACYKGHLDMVKFLLEAGADQEHKTDEMHTALMEASMDGHVEVARLLLDSGAQVNMPADSFESPLTLAACGGHIELASLLIERGANIEEVNDEGYTPLMEAAREGHEDMVALLLSQGADINAQTEETQETALTLACCGGFLEVADFLLRSGALIERGCSTPLMEAAQEGHLELVSFLLKSGANVEAQTGTHDTALTYACENGHTDVAEALLECGAKLEHESEGGRTPLMKAARAGHLCTVQFLISKGADVNRTTTSNDQTVLSLACGGGHLAVVELLLQHNADANHKLKDGSTMVIEAAKGGHTQVVKLLLEWPDRFLVNTATDQLAQLSVADAPMDEPRVPVQGLANIVPPSEPDSQSPLATATLASALQGKTDLIHQTLQKPLVKRVGVGQQDSKLGNKFCGPVISETFQPFFSDGSIMDDKSIDVDEKMLPSGSAGQLLSKEEQILRRQQMLEELQKKERELNDKGHAQTLAQAQHELHLQTKLKHVSAGTPSTSAATASSSQSMPSSSMSSLANAASSVIAAAGANAVTKAEQLQSEDFKYLDLPSQPMCMADSINLEQFNDFAKLLASGEFGSAASPCPDEYLQFQTQLHQQQEHLLLQQQQQALQLSSPPLPQTSMVTYTPSPNAPSETRSVGSSSSGSCSGKNQGNKRNGTNKQGRNAKGAQSVQQPPPPPPPPPPPSSVVHPVKGPLLLPLANQQQTLLPQGQPVVFQTEHNGASQSLENAQIVGSTSPAMLDHTHLQQLQVLTHQIQSSHQQVSSSTSAAMSVQQQQQLLAYPQLLPQEQLLQQMLSQPGLQQQLQMQQISQQVQSTQQALQGVANTQVTSAPPAHLSQQQQQIFQQQQQQAQQLLHQQLQQLQQPLKIPATSGNHTIAINKPQVVRKQQRVVQTTTQTVIHQNSIVNVDGNLSHANVQNLGVPSSGAYASVDVNSQTESTHDTALTLACAGGHAELVRLLLAKGANIEHRDKKFFTPLILSATAGHVDVVEILLEKGADIEAQSERTKDTALSLACSGGRYEVVELLLSKNANKEHRNVSDYTPLSLAASGGYVAIIKLLLSQSAEINSRTGSKLGISPLMLAAMNGHTAAVKLLLDMGSDINAQIETNRNTALTLACFQGRHEVVSLLVDRKANIEHRAKTGLTPLMEAASGGYVEVGRVLLDKGADVNAPPVPSSRDTALTIAADKGHYRFVELLLHRGASVDVKNKKGNSPLWLACNGGHSDVVSLLVQADADIDSQDNRKVSCLMAAFRRGHIKVVKWMVKKVTQFPSENEIKRYIATITDKELQKKCNQCADVIVAAKDRQAAEANKNADSLLEEIKQEKEQAALKAEMAIKRRERRRERKKKSKPKDDKTDKDSGKNSSPEPDGDSNKKEDDEDEEEEDDIPENPTVLAKCLKENKAPKGKVGNSNSGPQGNHSNKPHPAGTESSSSASRLLHDTSDVPSAPSNASKVLGTGVTQGGAAAARANRDARKKQQKAARENRRESSDQDAGLRNVKQALQVTMAKMTSLFESVVTATAAVASTSSPLLVSSVKMMTSTGSSSSPVSRNQLSSVHSSNLVGLNQDGGSSLSSSSQLSSGTNSNKESSISSVNGGGNKSRSKKSNDIKHSSTTGIGDLDDFGVIPHVIKNMEKINGKTNVLKKISANDNKKDWVGDASFFEKIPSVSNRLTATVRSPRKWQGKDEGWKEVVRKNVSKKLTVPGNVISRLIGKGGCNINKIREVSGAHVEVEKSKGNSDRTVTIKGYPEAIRQANNLINAMVDEPEKDISELLARIGKGQKVSPAAEKPHPQKSSQSSSIADFAIGTFSVPTTSNSGVSSVATKSPAQVKSSGRTSRTSATSNSNVMSGTIGAWQNPVPGQALPASPRRSPQKQVTPSPGVGTRPAASVVTSLTPSSEKTSARQLIFGNERGKRSSPSPVVGLPAPVGTATASGPTSSASLSFTTAATSTIRGVVTSSTILASTHGKQPDPRNQVQLKPAMNVGSSASPSAGMSGSSTRFSRPLAGSSSSRPEPLPLPIVTSGGNGNHVDRNGHGGSIQQVPGSSVPGGHAVPGEYSPFNQSLFSNFLAKKEEQSDKMDFASVAAAGVVTTSPPSLQTPSNPVSVTSDSNAVDPALQAKAPGFKIPQRGNSPPFRPTESDPSMSSVYRMPSSVGGNILSSGQMPTNNALPPHLAGMQIRPHFMENEYLLRYQQLNQHRFRESAGLGPMMHPHMMMRDLGAAGIPMPGAMLPQNMPFNPNQQQPSLVQKDEYSKPHRPMTLPEIKGALNPNAPEFQLPGSGGPLMNGFDRPLHLMNNMSMPMAGDLSGRMGISGDHSSPSASPNTGVNMGSLNAGTMPQMMQPGDMMGTGAPMQYMLHQVRPSSSVGNIGGGGSSPPQLNSVRMAAGPQHMIPPGMPSTVIGASTNPGYLSQSQGHQPQRAHSPMQNLAGGRPNSAPSIHQDAAIIGPNRSGSPLAARTSPPEPTKHIIQPIGGERKKGPTRQIPPMPNTGSFGTMWRYNNSGGNMGYPPRMSDGDEESMNYGMHSQTQYNETGGMPGGDGDHSGMNHASGMMVQGMYGNGSFPMGPMFQPKGACGDSQGQPLWSTAMTSAPSDPSESERWQSWNQ